ncbi:glutamate cyclase domain-containing protein [Tuwongella immobilis]|uniref:D-glutamate cyclase-like C-terminal domain-containing protein n=1 Tax=Tuwongella immobilis TaxID=692036 RepID=A0A6C2YJG4_9BACT|nr:glutamate cyclase domain-containing protein [Tuwongella immobilis]VIP01708.1 Putative uncharacterized protein OS=Moorea producens 3L GN=LYNGBM3L_08880 PE=4 SV=1: DUF4392 [Tuwongella immobilis]VTR99212.1 Putative uncharacterized protein OS=Moorea producens 3L GN=LYNGBM3L_08880 PE=4 SV=1: DUF4392 [Tuwongella immobilis]
MTESTRQRLNAIRDVVQVDIGNRGLARDPVENLLTVTRDDFAVACQRIAQHPAPRLGIITGFTIPTATPIAAETDGPLGAISLARACLEMGIGVEIVADPNCEAALRAGLMHLGLADRVPVANIPADREAIRAGAPWTIPPTHLIPLERVGPGHTVESLRAQPGNDLEMIAEFSRLVPESERGRCRSMRGIDVTDLVRPAHWLIEESTLPVIGIGDGGNEIGMGRIGWDIIRRNIPRGELVACRVPAEQLIVAGVSNWGAWALAAGIALLRSHRLADSWYNPQVEHDLLAVMVEAGPLVDGVIGKPQVTVDGLDWPTYVRPLQQLEALQRAAV